jgi:hypothetical protein
MEQRFHSTKKLPSWCFAYNIFILLFREILPLILQNFATQIDKLCETLCHKMEGRVLFCPESVNADPDPQHCYLHKKNCSSSVRIQQVFVFN